MTDAEGVVLALRAAREGGQAVLLAQGGHLLAASGEDLVRVGLVADVPHQTVAGRVVDMVQGDGQLDHAKTGAEMPTGACHGVEHVLAQLVGQGLQLAFAEGAQRGGAVDAVEQGRVGPLAGKLVQRLGHRTGSAVGQKIREFTRS
ncbi:hypothetical protein D3C81_1507440 [compost metagenome]